MIRIWESLSNTMFLNPVSTANSKPHWVANGSTSITEEGRGRCSKRETITWPCSFLITTPKPVVLSASKKALSMFTLYRPGPRGCHRASWRPTGATGTILCHEKTSTLSLARCNKWNSGYTFLPVLKLFLQVHKAHTIVANNASSLFSAKTFPIRSTKFLALLTFTWVHWGIFFHSSASFRQLYNACFTSSMCSWQTSRLPFWIIFLRIRLSLVGKEFLVALQTKFFTLLSTGRFQIACHNDFNLETSNWPGCAF